MEESHHTCSRQNRNNQDQAPEQTNISTSSKTNNTQTKKTVEGKTENTDPANSCVATSSNYSTKTKLNPPQSTSTTATRTEPTTARTAAGDRGFKGQTETSKRRRERRTKARKKMVMPP